VADCSLLYGLGKTESAPVDIWIHRTVRKLYFEGASVSTEKVARFLRERYRSWAGYAQLYLFHYARMTIMGRAQAPVFRHGVSEPSVVLKEYIQRQSKR